MVMDMVLFLKYIRQDFPLHTSAAAEDSVVEAAPPSRTNGACVTIVCILLRQIQRYNSRSTKMGLQGGLGAGST